jgi:methylamine dehydrogenase accessory protein MauD
MLEALLVSNVVLWVTVLVLAAVVMALVRQIGVLHERVAPAGALVGRDGPRVGEAAPRFELPDWSGNRVIIGGADADGRRTLLLFVSPTCPVCPTMLPIVDSVARDEHGALRVVLASDGPRAEHDAFVGAHRLAERPYVLSTELGLAYQVAKLPYAVLIDADGVLRAKGLVNTREHIESLFEAMARGVGSVQEFVRREREGGRGRETREVA